ncbi:MAG: hypothetical protein P8Q36_13965 [Alphaproteobacteria bacterium]|nr:hypothetical protein [Rhodospirillaceae bacterium]MBT6512941.1 hypothetical protein [Rhodospirillaceae bacterium]MBT7614133.1 hypothetical protein [Rhodospirillaceae bacterium]MBT7648411.1 hypothetical protein [Rhodospirillaceae bacterium]MDG2481953.1 hypothetical protein [Alphaproteobacteria bacterium]
MSQVRRLVDQIVKADRTMAADEHDTEPEANDDRLMSLSSALDGAPSP